MDELVAEQVLRAVELVPPGRVVSYGDLAELIGIGPRQVGAVMRAYGAGVTWWRVTNASGDFPPHLLDRAVPHWTEEGIMLKPNRRGCRIADHRADLVELARAFADAVADLEGR
jgi:alkylated DNA nucleotide flippase Atl1